ncbi:ankyrin [Aspergillus sclerotiicarbonarius CBS 121057]|uniref:Ankyrin n=1 Tax=Aspergillus sclerotiicarbonarius (strain CBS 121057 / IBT 28362) TaxID=1448318 RepID=A0A319EUX2_ASPSB|nr:ankyrin [Aspergillus sclerotiicarbonarius CBS 121057]
MRHVRHEGYENWGGLEERARAQAQSASKSESSSESGDFSGSKSESDACGYEAFLWGHRRRRNRYRVRDPMFQAISQGRVEVVRAYLERGEDESTDLEGRGLLYEAARVGSVPILQLLLAHGTQPNQPWGRFERVLDQVADDFPPPEQVVRVLVEAGATFTTSGAVRLFCWYASGPQLLEQALQNGTAILALAPEEVSRMRNDMLPLAVAAAYGRPEILAVLLDHAPGLLNQKHRGDSALGHAIQSRQSANAVYLLRRGISIIDAPTGMDEWVLETAARAGLVEVVQAILERPEVETDPWADRCHQSIVWAYEEGQLNVARLLLEKSRKTETRKEAKNRRRGLEAVERVLGEGMRSMI